MSSNGVRIALSCEFNTPFNLKKKPVLNNKRIMKIRNILSVAASACMFVGVAQGAQVNYNNTAGLYQALDASGVAIPQGTGYVAVGSFSSFTNAQIAAVGGADQTALNNLANDFNQFGASGTASLADGFFSNNAQFPTAGDTTFVGRNVYLIFGDGDSIVTSSSLFVADSQLVFLEDNPNSPNVDVFLDAILDGGNNAPVLGSTLSNGGTNPSNGALVDAGLAARVGIPEPSAALLTLFGALGLLVRRRR